MHIHNIYNINPIQHYNSIYLQYIVGRLPDARDVGRSVGRVRVLMNEKYDWTTPPAVGISISIVYIACATVSTYWQAGTRRYYVNCLISRYVIFCASSLTRVYGAHRRTTTPPPSQLPTNGPSPIAII